MHLRVAVDYSARDEIVRAAERLRAIDGPVTREAFVEALAGMEESGRDVDLLIRTGGEQRLSDFLLWECAYAELWFTPTMWPDFDADELRRALADCATRERRFSALPGSVPESVPESVPASAVRG